jgi:hypothetical protein
MVVARQMKDAHRRTFRRIVIANKVTCRRGYLRITFRERIVGSSGTVDWSSPSPLLDAAI